MVNIKIDFDIDEEFIEMFHRASQHEYTILDDGKMSLDEIRDYADKVCKTGVMQDQPRLGFLRIYDGEELVGLSVPRAIHKREHKVWCLPSDKVYYRMGMIFIDEPYRGMGYGKDGVLLFMRMYENILWTVEPANESSKKLAAYVGLTHNVTLYLKGSSWRHEPWQHERELEIWSN